MKNCTTRVKSRQRCRNPFTIKVWLHLGSALSALLFIVVLDEISKQVVIDVPWDIIYADDLQIGDRTLFWSREMTQPMDLCAGEVWFGIQWRKRSGEHRRGNASIDLQGLTINRTRTFKNLSSKLNEETKCEDEVRAKLAAALNNWRKVSPIIYDKKMPGRLERRVYETVLRPALLSGAETWAMLVKGTDPLRTTKSKICRWLHGKSRKDYVRNEGLL